jgi:hypothetical protein
MTGMYPQIIWKLAADPLGSAEHTLEQLVNMIRLLLEMTNVKRYFVRQTIAPLCNVCS